MAIFCFVLILVYKFIDMGMVSQIPLVVSQQKDGPFDAEFFRLIFASIIWIPYFCISRRVKATFRH